MAPLETLWPDELHVAPNPVAFAAMKLVGNRPLTSEQAMLLRGLDSRATISSQKLKSLTLDELSDLAEQHDLEVSFNFKAKA